MEPVSKLLNPGAFFEFEGVQYEVAPWNQAIQAEFEKYFVSEAWKNLSDQRYNMSEEDYREAQRMLRQDIDVGLYSFESDLVKKALNVTKHQKHLFFLAMAYAHKGNKNKPKVTRDLIDKIYKVPDKAEELYNTIIEVNRDPNSERAMTSKEELPDSKV